MQFGLICEGVTDFHVIKHVVQAYIDDAEFRPIQPNLDETHIHTTVDTFGGWELVKEFLKSDFFEDTVNNLDYVIIQIDTDVCEHINFGVSPITLANVDHEAFYELIKQKIIEWIDSYEHDTYDYYKEKIVFAISIHSIECWLLAYHGNKGCKILGCENELAAAIRRKGGKINTQNAKKAVEYIEYSRDLKRAKNHQNILVKSESFSKFVEQLKAIA